MSIIIPRQLQPHVIFLEKASCSHCKGHEYALNLSNIFEKKSRVVGTNTLAYYNKVFIATVKKFCGTVADVIKLFTAVNQSKS